LVHIVLYLCLSVSSLLGCSAFSGKVPRLVTVVALSDGVRLALLGVFLELGGVLPTLALALPWPTSIWWGVPSRQVHGDWDIV